MHEFKHDRDNFQDLLPCYLSKQKGKNSAIRGELVAFL